LAGAAEELADLNEEVIESIYRSLTASGISEAA
jgi:hypothetical protein